MGVGRVERFRHFSLLPPLPTPMAQDHCPGDWPTAGGSGLPIWSQGIRQLTKRGGRTLQSTALLRCHCECGVDTEVQRLDIGSLQSGSQRVSSPSVTTPEPSCVDLGRTSAEGR